MKRFYDYKCIACNHVQEYHEEYEDRNIEHSCPECGCAMQRKIGAPLFSFTKRPKNWDMKHSTRRELWNSPDPKDKRELV